MLSTLGPPRLAGLLPSLPLIKRFPMLEPVPVYEILSGKSFPLIPVTLVLSCVVVAKILLSLSLICSLIVKVSAAPDPPQQPDTPHSPFCTSTDELRVIPLSNIGWVITSDVRLNDCSIEPLSPNSKSCPPGQQSPILCASPCNVQPVVPLLKSPLVIKLPVVWLSAKTINGKNKGIKYFILFQVSIYILNLYL